MMGRAPAAVLLACGLLALAGGCTGRGRGFREAYGRETAGKQGEELRSALVALDQRYPRELSLKVNLGAMCLAAGDLPVAAAYLEQGERLARSLRFRRDRQLRYLLAANLAEHRLRAGRPEESAVHADRALALGVADEIAVVYTRAKARLASGDVPAALADFDAGRAASRQMNLEDYAAWIGALTVAGRPEEALAAHAEKRRLHGHASGQGLEESLLYERLGRSEEAVLSAFLELEHRRGAGSQSEAQILGNLEALRRRFQEAGAAGPVRLVSGLESYLEGDWAAAEAALAGLSLPTPHLGREYLLLAARLEQGAAVGELDAYARLEPELRTLAAFYYHLWKGLRAAGGAYRFGTARPVLEKTILLGPEGRFAEETRVEIGRLLGLPAAQGRQLLLGQEAQARVRRAAAESRPDALEPVLALLALPDTAYSAEALLALQPALAVPVLRQHLQVRRDAAEGRLRERLVGLLGE